MSNRLKYETSPYLLQHAENPVNWYPWCEEAFETARREDKPIFLSIGYSTCHWCHVMAHESFEDEETAAILNEHFVSIKVDREERPDIDSVYMTVCQAFTGSGGWPTSIFMTRDKQPFFAGTYFPVHSRYGMPGFCDLLRSIADQWSRDRQKLVRSAIEITNHLKRENAEKRSVVRGDITEQAVTMFTRMFDRVHGGFGVAPKFPTPHNLLFLMLYAKQAGRDDIGSMAEKTLVQMRRGGLFDHIGYGFCRYSTDDRFLVPHFEKMLYDNALLMIAYTAAYSASHNAVHLDTAEKIAAYILREMTAAQGGFYSAQDADSDGVEGKYYTFTLDEILSVLGNENGNRFAKAFDITAEGNFEGVNIPNLLKSQGVDDGFSEDIQKLYNYRKQRAALHLDDKILLAWNSLMIAALAMLYRVSHNEDYREAAQKAEEYIEKSLCNGLQLYTSSRNGKRSEKGFLDDYAFYVSALIELYNMTLDREYLERAERFSEETVTRFSDLQNGGFHLCETGNTELFMNPKETYDGAIPSGNAVMAYNFVRLYQLTEKESYRDAAEKQLAYMSAGAGDFPAGHSLFLLAKLLYEVPPKHIVVVLKDPAELNGVRQSLPFLSNTVVVSANEDYPLVNDQTTYYVCRGHTCLPPTNTLAIL